MSGVCVLLAMELQLRYHLGIAKIEGKIPPCNLNCIASLLDFQYLWGTVVHPNWSQCGRSLSNRVNRVFKKERMKSIKLLRLDSLATATLVKIHLVLI